ncbi:unnamed protein product, partial [Brenthis ino]
MADAVPVCDVLLEAMEYLSKLGSNLRVRSENFKQKKLRKDKLRNTHAVQKAANKVLLICELSKKSILNVEAGVKQILTQIDASQGSTSRKTKDIISNTNQDESNYFEYESKKLRIRRKVNLKHFTSVKVLAKAMPLSMQDKYPLYYNCKLYQTRKEKQKKNSKEESTHDILEDSFNDNQTSVSSCNLIEKDVDELSTTTNKMEKKHEDHQLPDTSAGEQRDKSKKKEILQKSPDIKKSKKFRHIKIMDSTDSDSDARQNVQSNEKECGDKPDAPMTVCEIVPNKEANIDKEGEDSLHCSNKDGSSCDEDSQVHILSKDTFDGMSGQSANCETIAKHSSGKLLNVEYEQEQQEAATTPEVIIEKKDYPSIATKECERDVDIEKKKILISHSEKLESNEMIDKGKCNDNEEPKLLIDPNTVISDASNTSTICKGTENEKGPDFDNDNSQGSTDSRPFIKCVNINKLLREDKIPKKKEQSFIEILDSDTDEETKDVIKKSKHKENDKHRSKLKNRHKLSKNHAKPLHKTRRTSSESSKTDDEDYWKQKRKEVKEFKPKSFKIVIARKYELTEKFLHEQNLKRITRYGSIICELSLQNDKEEGLNIPVEKQSLQIIETNKSLPSKDINVVKNALLNDSDSDCDKETEKANKIKKVLLDESDTENVEVTENQNPQLSNTEIIDEPSNVACSENNNQENIPINNKSKILDEQGTDNIEEETNMIDNGTIKIKEGTIKNNNEQVTNNNKLGTDNKEQGTEEKDNNNDNSSDTNEANKSTTNSKRKRRSSSPLPSSKRKRIMESMHAKKMLLNCSSSSETEDEQLKNVLNEIRDSLLKGGSDEEDETIKRDDSDDISSNVCKGNTTEDSNHCITECDSLSKDSDSQVEENNEVNSNSSSRKMGRSKSKPPGSSSQNTDTQESFDKEIDGLTDLKTLTKKHRRRRRRRSTSTDCTQSSSSRSKKKMPKTPQISEEGFLKAESSSDAASLADSDVGEEVEIPAVSLSGLNGDSLDHLAKDDLLEESMSSSSHEKSSGDIKKEEESEEENVKLRRRKANAISSDSEAGGSRKKDRDVRLSDFEDSDVDSEPAKKSKRKKKGSESDDSVASSGDGSKKKRRRIKNIDDSEEASGSESETEGRNKHGRKNIRKVMGKNQLEEATKKAAREEKERIARIAERQKLYNNLQFDESGKPDEVVLDKVVLDFDPETKEPLIEVDKGLVKKLKPHQANGIKFMWDACFESVKRIKKDKGSGCILAHCMGLGKTLQVVSLTHTLLTHSALTRVHRVLVVCPLSTVLNWVNEFRIWLKHAHADFDVDVYELSRHKQNSERAWQLQQWFSGGGVCVLGYEMFRNLSADNNKKFKKKMLKSFQESLVDPGPDLVVCDEGHLLKNEKTSLSQAMNRVKTLRRIVLTGTPLQNNLKEYYCMVQFVKPNLLGKYNEYLNRFVNPITNGQYTDSTEHDIRVMKRRSHVLHKMLDGAVQRRDYGVLAPFLPPKHEYVLFITLTEVQIKLYQHYLDNYSRRPLAGKSSGFLFPDFQSLQRIWTHPLVLKYNSERYEIMQQKKREREEEDSEGSLADFIDDNSTPDESSTEESSDSLSDMSDDSRKKSKKKKSAKKSKAKESKVAPRRGTRANPIEVEDDDDVVLDEGGKAENPTEWWMPLVPEEELDDLRHSHKLVLLFDILRQCETIGDKLLVFSQSLYSLDLIEHFLGKVDEATQEGRVDEKLNSHVGSWSPGIDYFRLDGSTSCENRSIWCKNFNKEDNPRARLFLISTRAGGLGINLVAANRVVIFDVSWNPSHDVQSIFRVYRFGQKKPCYVYRFLAMGTMEEKIYERQVTKQAISKRVIDEQQIDRHYAENDLAELYKFEPHPPSPRELPPLPKDRLFAEMLKEHEAQIYKYHEHDSLLENKEEETLTEEERKAAWEDFENEKTRPPPAPFSAYMHNGMMPGLLQQQSQLAYATLAALLQKKMPNASDAQIREALYHTNPAMFGGYDYGFLQKMGELYKYAQPGMMNPGMLNPVMNPVGGMSLGGSSGLQYEPPWQRQQQEQMRMQQMIQHQNLYAGGLGSRDPVAMALQQQRARELMLGERGRPRGRPSRQDPPLPANDIVNLDSD